MLGFYRLDAIGEPERVDSWAEWAAWYGQQHQGDCTLRRVTIGWYTVNTLFLGIDHRSTEGEAPLLWETQVNEDPPAWIRRIRRWLGRPEHRWYLKRTHSRAAAYRDHFEGVRYARRGPWL